MKTRLMRCSRRTLSTLLVLLMMVSTIMVGTISASAYTSIAGRLYFDNSKTSWSNVYLYVGHGSYAKSYTMTNTGYHNIWYLDISDTFTDRTKIFFANHNDSPNGQNYGIDTQYGWNTTNTNRTALTTANDSDANSLFTPSSNSAGTLTRSYPRVVSGDLSSNGWDDCTDIMTYSSSQWTKTYTNVAAGDYSLAVVGFYNNWNPTYRWAAKGTISGTGGSWADANDNDHNIKLTLAQGTTYDVTVTLTSSNKVNINVTPRTITVTYSIGSHINLSSVKVNSSTVSSPSSPLTVDQGSNVVFNVTYDSGYEYSSSSSLDGATPSSSNTKFTYSSISSNKTLNLVAKEKDYTITITNDKNSTTSSVTGHIATGVTVSAPNPGAAYAITGWKVTQGSIKYGGTTYGVNDTINVAGNLTNVTTTQGATLQALFGAASYNITFSQPSNGTLKINGSTTSPQSVASGATYTLSFTPNEGYKIASLSVAGSAISAAVNNETEYLQTYTMGTSNITVAGTTAICKRTVTVNQKLGDAAATTLSTDTNADIATVKTLTAATVANYVFAGWYASDANSVILTQGSLGDPSSATIKIKPKANVTLTAVYNDALKFSATFEATGLNGSQTPTFTPSSIGGLVVGGTSNISAGSVTGYRFTGWSIDDSTLATIASPSSASTSITVTKIGEAVLTASYQEYMYAVSVNSADTSKGTVSITSGSTTAGIDTTISISAAPKTGYKFKRWVPGAGITVANANSSSTTVNATAAGTVTAEFEEITATVTISAGTGGSVSPSGARTVSYYTATSVTATPETGYSFANWTTTGGARVASATANPASLTVSGATNGTLQANFNEQMHTVLIENGTAASTTAGISTTGSATAATLARKTFTHWNIPSGITLVGCSSTDSTITFNATEDGLKVTAVYEDYQNQVYYIPKGAAGWSTIKAYVWRNQNNTDDHKTYTWKGLTISNATTTETSTGSSYNNGNDFKGLLKVQNGDADETTDFYYFKSYYSGNTPYYNRLIFNNGNEGDKNQTADLEVGTAQSGKYALLNTSVNRYTATWTDLPTPKYSVDLRTDIGGTIRTGASAVNSTSTGGYITSNVTIDDSKTNRRRLVVGETSSTTVTAHAKTGYTFDGWYKGDDSSVIYSTDATITVTASQVYNLTAKFTHNTYAVNYPSSGNFSLTQGATSAHYQDTVTFSTSANTNYRITAVYYQAEGSSTKVTIGKVSGSTTQYSFSMPNSAVTIHIETVRTYTLTFTKNTGVSAIKYTYTDSLGAETSNLTTTPYVIDAGSTVVFTVTYANGYKYKSGGVGTASNSNKTFTVTNVSANINFAPVAQKIDYTITATPSPSANCGSLKVTSDAAGNNVITTAQIGDTFYVTATPASAHYKLSSYSIAGTGSGKTATNGNVGTFTMGYANVTVTGTFEAVTPVWGTNPDQEVIAGNSLVYTADVTPYTRISYIVRDSASGAIVQNIRSSTNGQLTIDAANISAAGKYVLTMTAYNNPGNSVSQKSAVETVDITVKYPSDSIYYYVDMHDTTAAPTISIVDSSGTELEDENSTKYTFTMASRGNGVYSKNIDTPILSGQTSIYVTIEANGVTPSTIELNVAKLRQNHEIWFEAANGTFTELTTKLSTRTKPSTTVNNVSYKKYYLAKPRTWSATSATTEQKNWTTIGLYYWNSSQATTEWASAPQMDYLGYDNNYYYYSCSIPDDAENIIFQGRGQTGSTLSTYLQTDNLETADGNFWLIGNKMSNNHFACSTVKDSDNEAVQASAPFVSKFYNRVEMNLQETQQQSIAPVAYEGEKISYEIINGSSVTVNSETGVLTPVRAGTTEIKTTVYGTVGKSMTYFSAAEALNDYVTYTTTVVIHDPENIEGFFPMSYASNLTEISIPDINGVQPGYFNSIQTTLTGVANGNTYTGAGIVESLDLISVSDTDKTILYNVKYAAPSTEFSATYGNIKVTAALETKSILRNSNEDRFGFDYWQKNESKTDTDAVAYTRAAKTSAKVENSVETTSLTVNCDGSKLDAIFAAYEYTDVTFTFKYYEYKTERTVTDEEGNTTTARYYFYDPTYADENNSNGNFAASHISREYTLNDVEVRAKAGESPLSESSSDAEILEAAEDNMHDVENNYYTYSVSTAEEKENTAAHAMSVTINMAQTPRTYSVKVNDNYNFTTDEKGQPIYYQSYVDIASNNVGFSANQSLIWTDADSGKELAIGAGYRFRVTGSLNISAALNSSNKEKDNSSVVDYAGHEITHEAKLGQENMDNPEIVEKLIQNFYIADFFSPDKVTYQDPDDIDPVTNEGRIKTYDDVKFVGGGVMYYSVDDSGKARKKDIVNNGYVDEDSQTGNAVGNKDALVEFISDRILTNKGDEDDEDLANAVAYGTAIPATTYNSMVYRYLPAEEYVRVNGELQVDQNGNYVTKTNSNTFRYSNALGAYQYIYASKAENKATNAGKNMRLYAYYVYSYTDYDANDVPYTAYKVVISDSYADASTYWNTTV